MSDTTESLRVALWDKANNYCRFCGNEKSEGHAEDCQGVAWAIGGWRRRSDASSRPRVSRNRPEEGR